MNKCNDNEKRSNQFIINLTDKQAEILKRLAREQRRRNSEALYIMVSDILADYENELKEAISYDKKTGYTNIKI